MNRIKRNFFIYIFFVLVFTFWNILGGVVEEVNTASYLVRGVMRISIPI